MFSTVLPVKAGFTGTMKVRTHLRTHLLSGLSSDKEDFSGVSARHCGYSSHLLYVNRRKSCGLSFIRRCLLSKESWVITDHFNALKEHTTAFVFINRLRNEQQTVVG